MIERGFSINQFFLPCVVLLDLHWDAGLYVIFTTLLDGECVLVEGMRAFEVLVLDKCLCLLPTHINIISFKKLTLAIPQHFIRRHDQLAL